MMEYGYLAPDANKIESMVVTQQMIKTVQDGSIKRLIFQNVEYDAYQTEKIEQLKKFLKKQGMPLYSDVMLLKFLYVAQFDFKQCLRRIEIYEQWMHNPLIQGTNKKAESILRQGILYSYGRDYEFRPIVIFKVSYVDLTKVISGQSSTIYRTTTGP